MSKASDFFKSNPNNVTKKQIGLSEVDNTSDLDKPVSDAQAVRMAAMSKADFDALAEKRIRDNASSGFAEWGKDPGYVGNVNKGMWARPDQPNLISIGRGWTDASGVSRTNLAIAVISGVSHHISNVNGVEDIYNPSNIIFPPAPDGTKTYDSATGVVTQHASSNEAFEGLVTNGDFRNGAAGWGVRGEATLSATNGIMTVTNANNTPSSAAIQNIFLTLGEPVRIEFQARSVTGEGTATFLLEGAGNGYAPPRTSSTEWVSYAFDYVPTGTGVVAINLREAAYSGAGHQVQFRNISLMPATEKVITSRQDYAFLESFHEKISDKDVVYPLGNVQYGAPSYEGIAIGTNGIAQGYSAFGEWDSKTVGNCAVWSNLTTEQKILFLQDPKNNIYEEGGELIQVRYRVRVVEGKGSGEWYATVPTRRNYATGNPSWLSFGIPLESSLIMRGSSVDSSDYYLTGTSSTSELFGGTGRAGDFDKGDMGIWQPTNAPTVAHNGLCFAIPIAVVQRMNQGAYHPSYNPYGCSKWRAGAASTSNIDSWWDWHKLAEIGFSATSISDAFNPALTYVDNGGYISGTTGSGRPTKDPIQYYDAIYASQVHDLRIESNYVPEQELFSREVKRAIAGEIRGKEGVPFTTVHTQTLPDSNGAGVEAISLQLTDTSGISVGDYGYTQKADGSYYRYRVESVAAGSINVVKVVPDGSRDRKLNGYILHEALLPSEYETLPWQDIIGDPANIAATFPNGVMGQWIPNTPLTVPFKLNRKCLDNNVDYTYSGNFGASWVNVGVPVDVTNNEVSPGIVTDMVVLVSYSTKANPYELAPNGEVIGEVGSVFAGGFYIDTYGASLVNGLLNKVATGNVGNALDYGGAVVNYVYMPSSRALSATGIYSPEHDPLRLGILDGSPVVKAFPYLTQENQQYYLQWVYKELAFDRNSFVPSGDDGKFDIVSGESTALNLNGRTIKVGQKRVALPNLMQRKAS